ARLRRRGRARRGGRARPVGAGGRGGAGDRLGRLRAGRDRGERDRAARYPRQRRRRRARCECGRRPRRRPEPRLHGDRIGHHGRGQGRPRRLTPPPPAFEGSSRPMARFLVVLDVDSTLIEDEVIELLAEAAGSLDAVAEVTLRAMNGELDFAESLRERVATLEGLPETVFADVAARVTVTRGVPEMIAGVQGAGARVAVVSGGVHEIIDPLARSLGLDDWRANRLEVVEGRLTGRVVPPVVDAAAKAEALQEWADAAGIP